MRLRERDSETKTKREIKNIRLLKGKTKSLDHVDVMYVCGSKYRDSYYILYIYVLLVYQLNGSSPTHKANNTN